MIRRPGWSAGPGCQILDVPSIGSKPSAIPVWPGPLTMLGVPRERVLVTGSAGHLGEALVRVLREQGRDVVGLDLLASPFTTVTRPVTDRAVVRRCLEGVGTVLHAGTLHKPHI